MGLARSIKRRLRAAGPAAIFLSLVGYFAWNATRGDLGLHSYSRREGDLAAANQSLAAANAERDAWQQRVAALQSHGLEADALDERARAMLSLVSPDEVVIPVKK